VCLQLAQALLQLGSGHQAERSVHVGQLPAHRAGRRGRGEGGKGGTVRQTTRRRQWPWGRAQAGAVPLQSDAQLDEPAVCRV
jgi:hypothetical protein